MRTFIAIRLPDEVKELLKSVQSGLDRGFKGVSWVRPESIHLTLKFLGEIDDAKVREVSEALEKASSAVGPFAVEVQGVGCFPNSRSPRVVWVGIRESAPLLVLQRSIEERLAGLGFETEDRAFTPHLTLCRVKSPVDGRSLGRLLTESAPEVKAGFTAASFAFMKSVLKPSGAEYTPIREFALTGGK